MSAKASDRFIPWYIVAFFVALTALYTWFMTIAHDSYPGVVTEKAYDKGLRYNDTIARAEQQEKLGWKSAIATRTAGNGDAIVTLSLQDAQGRPVAGAHVMIWFLRPVKSGIDHKTAMAEVSPGLYEARAALGAKGLWEVRAEAVRGDSSFQASRKATFE